MPEDIVVRQCAPTLAGIKTGNLFSCHYEGKEEIIKEIRCMNRRLTPKGIHLLPLRYTEKRVLLYLFRPAKLRRDLADEMAREVLEKMGYKMEKGRHCITQLIQRFQKKEGFPHEIGLFLSYPPEDVKGFIDNKASNYKYSGLWKVYGDEICAKKLFEKYRKCTECYCESWRAGVSIEQLAVAIS